MGASSGCLKVLNKFSFIDYVTPVFHKTNFYLLFAFLGKRSGEDDLITTAFHREKKTKTKTNNPPQNQTKPKKLDKQKIKIKQKPPTNLKENLYLKPILKLYYIWMKPMLAISHT